MDATSYYIRFTPLDAGVYAIQRYDIAIATLPPDTLLISPAFTPYVYCR